MSDNLDHRIEDRVRSALLDLDRRAAQHVARPAAGDLPRTSRARRRWAPALAGFAVVVLLVTVALLIRPTPAPAPALHPPRPTASATQPSQTPAEALRDGVLPALAALPVSKRLAAVDPLYEGTTHTRITAAEGVWLISRPDISDLSPDTGCLPGRAGGTGGTTSYRVCSDYSEILLMTPDLRQVIRAFPIPGEPVQWIVLTPEAIYCGRQGDGAIADSMVCRIGRASISATGRSAGGQAFTARVFPPETTLDADSRTSVKGWPGLWTTNAPDKRTGFDQADLNQGLLRILSSTGETTVRLDPASLEPVL
jgi:hypothetical protein